MKKIFWLLAAGAIASAAMAVGLGRAADRVELSLTRLDCGSVQVNDLNVFSDTDAYTGQQKRLTSSCYLIRHGNDLMLWDTGLPAALKGAPDDPTKPMSATLDRTLVEQLADLGVKPEQIGHVGLSHYHFDHMGQAADFAQATLLIGKGDWDAMTSPTPPETGDPKMLAPWISGGGKVEALEGDKDVFDDGSVVMLSLPGHTPGHHALLVRLRGMGPVLLTGDLAHFQENYDTNGVPDFNTDRADSLASLDRFKKLAASYKAKVIIQHEPADLAKLPAYPKAAS